MASAISEHPWKAGAVTLSTALLLVLLLGEIWVIPRWSAFWADNSAWTNVACTLLLAGMAWGVFLIDRQRRIDRFNRSVTGMGLAGLVEPLLRVSLILREMDSNCAALWQARSKETNSRATKWAKPYLAGRKGLPRPRRFGGRDNPLKEKRVTLIDDCIREVVGSVRDWIDVLTVTELGQASLYCIQALRRDMQEVQMAIENDRPPAIGLSSIQQRCLFMGISFELASFPRHCREEVLKEAEFFENQKYGRASPDETILRTVLLKLSVEIQDESELSPTKAQDGQENIRWLYRKLDAAA